MSTPLVLRSGSVEATQQLGERLGRVLSAGDFVGLSGGLGAGKTVFARGVARGAGVPESALVSSPTFAIVNAYQGGRLPLYHADLYRIEDAEELYDAGFYDLGDDGALLVEWIQRVPEVAPAEWLEIKLAREGSERILELVAHGARAAELAEALAAG